MTLIRGWKANFSFFFCFFYTSYLKRAREHSYPFYKSVAKVEEWINS